MNGRTSKSLRRIAKSLSLPEETGYLPGGELRRKPAYRDVAGVLQPGAPIRRPFVLRACWRRAYKEAKKIFLGKPISICVPEGEVKQSFQATVTASIKEYASQD
jgi:hypothetical protein